jgi:oligosaccharide repeat unit polymerase
VRAPFGFLRLVFITGWTCLASLVVWQIHSQAKDSVLAVTAGVLFLASIALSRYTLGLAFTAGPMLYLALFGLFHLGLVVPWALRLYDVGRMPWFAAYGLSPAIILIIYALLAYQFGLIVAYGRGKPSEKAISADDVRLENPKMFAVGMLLFVSAAVMFFIGLIQLDPVGYYRLTYSDTFRLRAESDPRLFGTGITIALIGLCLAMAGAAKDRVRLVFLCAALWVLPLFYIGFRGPALIVGLIVCTIATKKGLKFPRWAPWVSAVLILVAIPVMRQAREDPLNDRSFTSSLREFNILDGPAEMGGSIRPLIEVEALIGSANYRYGKTYLVGLKGVVPNLALRWEAPATEAIEDLPPSHWLTAVVDPWTYRNYGGMGFSAVAEPFMNFGVAGVLAYFFLIAVLLTRLDQTSIRNAYALASWALVLAPLLWTIRNDFANFFRPVVWGLLCLGLIWLFSGGRTLISPARGANKISLGAKAAEIKRI